MDIFRMQTKAHMSNTESRALWGAKIQNIALDVSSMRSQLVHKNNAFHDMSV